jgi:hypothetical protein
MPGNDPLLLAAGGVTARAAVQPNPLRGNDKHPK